MGAPYRNVQDSELRDIFYLTPQTGTSFMFTVHTPDFPGSESPAVTPILRDMLTVHDMSSPQREQLKRHIAQTLSGRDQIPIQAHLISLVDRAVEEPWAFPVMLDTPTCRELWHEFNSVATGSNTVASTGADPVSSKGIGAALVAIFKKTGALITFSVGYAQYIFGKNRDYYAFHAKRISDELALRGIPPSSLK